MTDTQKKIVVIGDGGCGKTAALTVYVTGKFPDDYLPTVFDSFIKETEYDGNPVNILLMDTSGQEDYERIRSLQYVDTDVFAICFSVDNVDSFKNVKSIWIKEVRKFKLPWILVGLKSDLRSTTDDCVSQVEARRFARRSGVPYVECSALNNSNIEEMFKVATRVALTKRKPVCALI